ANHRPRPEAVRHRRDRGGHRSPATTATAGQDQDQRGRRTEAGRTGMYRPAPWPMPLDSPAARRRDGGPGPGRLDQHRDRAAGAGKNDIQPWIVQSWCIPPQANAEFVWRMEDVIQTYMLPYDPKRPVICFDEASKQLFGEVRAPQRVR